LDKSSDKSKPLNADRDAQRWAREFKAICAAVYGGDIADRLDDGWLISWFANAIMCGEDTYRWRKEAEAKAVPSANQRTFDEWWISATFDTMDPKTMAQRGWDAALKNTAALASVSQHPEQRGESPPQEPASAVPSSIEPLKRPEEGWRLDAFESALARAINGHSIENESNTPDFILAMLARDVLIAFAKATKNRERWYGK